VFSGGSDVSYNLFNPSIGDYVLRRYANDVAMLRDAVICMRSQNCVSTLTNLKNAQFLDEKLVRSICISALSEATTEGLENYEIAYIALLCFQLIPPYQKIDLIPEAVKFLVRAGSVSDSSYLLFVVKCALELDWITSDAAVDFIFRNIEDVLNDDDITETLAILTLLSKHPAHDNLLEVLNERVIAIASDSLGEFIEITDAFAGLAPGEDDRAEEKLVDMVMQKFDELGLEINRSDAGLIVRSIDVGGQLESYQENSYDGDEREYHHVRPSGPDEVDDLFDRG
jgi:hypothetical protein